jgi:hypothetical protein
VGAAAGQSTRRARSPARRRAAAIRRRRLERGVVDADARELAVVAGVVEAVAEAFLVRLRVEELNGVGND